MAKISLKPLTLKNQELIALHLCDFFAPSKYNDSCNALGVNPNSDSIDPFSLGDFMNYLKSHVGFDGFGQFLQIGVIIQKLVNNGILIQAGNIQKNSPPFHQCYLAIPMITDLRKDSTFWLGKVLGEGYLTEKYKPFIIRFEGLHLNGESATGSGVLIDNKTILTCRHNLTDIISYKCFLGDFELEVERGCPHYKHDIGIVKLSTPIDHHYFPYFGSPMALENTLTLGYPPLRGMREAPLISQKGEINAISRDWNGCDCITISSIIRPGNSGGPVISMEGHIVGIVTQHANSATGASADKNEHEESNTVPFYNAIASTALVQIIKELDDAFCVRFENFD